MGCFTWTLANKPLVKLKSGEYSKSSILRYDGYGAIVCPDNILIKEYCYEGYGKFDGKDIYELVADWNKEHLTDIPNIPGFQALAYDPETNMRLLKLLKAFSEDNTEELQTVIDDIAQYMPLIKTDWKKFIGIFIACKNNHLLPYPIKIVDSKRPVRYDQLPPSIHTQ